MIRARPVGVLHMTDEAGGDAKLIAVPHDKLSVLYKDVKEYTDLPALLLEQIKHFFENYKDLEKASGSRSKAGATPTPPAPRSPRPWPRSRNKRASPKSPQPRGFSFSLADRQGRSRHPLRSVDRRHALQPISVAVDGQQLPTTLGGQAKLVAQAIDGYPAAARTTLPRGARSARRDIPAITAVPGWRTGSGPGGIRARSG